MAVKWPDIYLEFHRAHPTITTEGTIRLVMDLEAERDRLASEKQAAHETVCRLSDQVERLTRELAEAREDGARLDWLEHNRLALNRHYGTDYGWKVVRSCNVNRVFVSMGETRLDLHDSEPCGTDIRAALDAARQKEQGNG